MKPIVKYDHLLNRFRENDFSDAEVAEIRDLISGTQKPDMELNAVPSIVTGSTALPVAIINDEAIAVNDSESLAKSIAIGTIILPVADNDTPYVVPMIIDAESLSFEASGSGLFKINGITETIEFEKNQPYIVTGVHHVSYNDVVYDVLTFMPYEQKVTLADIFDYIKNSEILTASEDEYNAFKSHLQTEIATILTPITEEENNGE